MYFSCFTIRQGLIKLFLSEFRLTAAQLQSLWLNNENRKCFRALINHLCLDFQPVLASRFSFWFQLSVSSSSCCCVLTPVLMCCGSNVTVLLWEVMMQYRQTDEQKDRWADRQVSSTYWLLFRLLHLKDRKHVTVCVHVWVCVRVHTGVGDVSVYSYIQVLAVPLARGRNDPGLQLRVLNPPLQRSQSCPVVLWSHWHCSVASRNTHWDAWRLHLHLWEHTCVTGC